MLNLLLLEAVLYIYIFLTSIAISLVKLVRKYEFNPNTMGNK